MGEFRTKHPLRRNITRHVSRYSDHKEDLRIDFNQRCGYCDCVDRFKMTYYEIDHFIPKKILTKLTETDYKNLVYACRSCNNAKRGKWPTNNEDLCHNGEKGFIDPCDAEYSKQFCRNQKGEIIPVTELGKWMFQELHLFKQNHAIIWNLEQLCLIIEELQELTKEKEGHPLYKKMCDLCLQYYKYDTALRKL